MAENSPFTTPSNRALSSTPASSPTPLDTPITPLSQNPPIPAPTGAPAESSSIMPTGDGLAAGENVVAPTGEEQQLEATRNSGAGWFFWIAALSFINTALVFFGSEMTLALGLGSTLFVDAIAGEIAKTAGGASMIIRAIELVLDFFIIGTVVLMGVMAQKGKGWAFVVGGILMLLDTVLMLAVQEWISVAIHVWALVCIFGGWQANKKLQAIKASQAQGPSPWTA